MKFKLIFGLIFLLSISFTYALTITSPSTSVSGYFNISWDSVASATRYSINLTNSTGSNINIVLNNSVASSFTRLTNVSATTNSNTYVLAFRQEVNGLLDNSSTFTLFHGTTRTAYSYAILTLFNGSTITSGVCSGGTILKQCSYGVANNTNVRWIEYYHRVSQTDATNNLSSNNIRMNYMNSYFPSLLNYNLSIAQYGLNVSAYNSSGVLIDSSIVFFNLTSNALLNISASSPFGITISSFNISIKDLTTNISTNYTTTTSLIEAYVVNGRSYNLTFSAFEYITSTNTLAIISTYQATTITAYPDASILVNLFDEMTGLRINQSINTTITDITNPYVVRSTSSNGSSLISGLPTGDLLELKFTSMNYSDGRNYRIILSGVYSTLDVYLLPKSVSQNFSICWYDQNGVQIYDLHTYQWYLSNTSFVLTQDVFSSVSGQTRFVFTPTHYYLYNISSEIYENFPFILNPPTNTNVLSDGCNYAITLRFKSGVQEYALAQVTGSASFDNSSKILSFNYVSSDDYSSYSYKAVTTINSKESILCSGSSVSSSDSFSCDLTGYSGDVRVYGYADDTLFFGGIVRLDSPPTLFDTLNRKDAAFISGFIILIIVFGGVFFGLLGTMIAGVLGLVVISWIGLFPPLTTISILASVIIVGVINFGLRRWR